MSVVPSGYCRPNRPDKRCPARACGGLLADAVVHDAPFGPEPEIVSKLSRAGRPFRGGTEATARRVDLVHAALRAPPSQCRNRDTAAPSRACAARCPLFVRVLHRLGQHYRIGQATESARRFERGEHRALPGPDRSPPVAGEFAQRGDERVRGRVRTAFAKASVTSGGTFSGAMNQSAVPSHGSIGQRYRCTINGSRGY